MSDITIYGISLSTYVRTTRLLLAEAGLDHQLELVDIFTGANNTDEYRQIQPFGKIPAAKIDGNLLYETLAITHYLNTLAGGRFLPSEPLAQARVYQIASIVTHYLYSPAILTIAVQRIFTPQGGGQADEAAVEAAIEPVKTAMNAIAAIHTGTPFLVGDAITLADFYLIPIFVYLAQTPDYDVVTAEAPQLKAWWERVQDRDSVKAMCN